MHVIPGLRPEVLWILESSVPRCIRISAQLSIGHSNSKHPAELPAEPVQATLASLRWKTLPS